MNSTSCTTDFSRSKGIGVLQACGIRRAFAAILVLCGLSASQPIIGQEQAPKVAPPAPPSAPASGSVGRNPSVTYLMEAYKISESEARERIELQGEIIALTDRIHQQNDPAFAGITIQHEPVYKVIISFADNKDRNSFLAEIPPRLRRYVQLRVAKRSKAATKDKMAELTAALNKGGESFVLGYNNKEDAFLIYVESQAVADKLKALVPSELSSDVRFNIAPLPKQQSLPTGVKSGDYALGGYYIYTTTTNVPCTLAFPITYGANSTPGILTAAHCTEPKYIQYSDGHKVTFPAAFYENNSGAYDYAIYNATGLTTTYQIYYKNDYNRIPEFATSGWLNTINFIRGWNQVNGMTICKSGEATDLTCGTIVDDSFEQRPGWWFIRVSHTKQYDISNPGDSGGPWFLYPGTSPDITAAGIHMAGSGTGAASYAVYMPIDRIFDHVSNVRLVLKP